MISTWYFLPGKFNGNKISQSTKLKKKKKKEFPWLLLLSLVTHSPIQRGNSTKAFFSGAPGNDKKLKLQKNQLKLWKKKFEILIP